MMPVYAVMSRIAGNTWIDSIWVRKCGGGPGADTRAAELKSIHQAFKIDSGVWVVQLTLQDGEETPRVPGEAGKA